MTAVKGLRDSGAFRWQVSGAGSLSARLDDTAEVAERVGAPKSESRIAFEKVLRTEIVPIVNRLAGVPIPSDLVFEDRPELTGELLATRTKLVEAAIFDPSLRQRVTVRKTSKGPVLEELRWDISVKKHDLATGKLPDIVFATIELIYLEAALEARGPAAMLGLGPPKRSLVFDCHSQDLDALINDLQSLRANLEKLEKLEKSP